MQIISCLNQKGGSDKTTVCINLDAALSANKKRVVVFDLDPQLSASEWSDRAKQPPQTYF